MKAALIIISEIKFKTSSFSKTVVLHQLQ